MAGQRMPLRLATLVFFMVFVAVPSEQTCGVQKTSEMHYSLKGHAYSASEVDEYPACLKICLGDVNCASFNYNFMNKECQLNNKTKLTEPGSFIKKDYTTYTEVTM